MKILKNPLLILLYVFIISNIAVFTINLSAMIIILLLSLGIILLQRTDHKALNKMLKRIKASSYLFITLFIIQSLFHQEGIAVVTIKGFSITYEGMLNSLLIILRLIIIILSVTILSHISFGEYMKLFRRIRMPVELVFLISFVIHLFPQIEEQFRNKLCALKLRGIVIEKLSIYQRLALILKLVLPVLGTILSDAKYQAIALDLKGFRKTLVE